MKRVLSLVLTAAIAASLVPATAFAANGDVKATAKVVGAWTRSKDTLGNGVISGVDTPELQLKVTSADLAQTTDADPVQKVTVSLDNAEFLQNLNALNNGITVRKASDGGDAAAKKEYSYRKMTEGELKSFLIDFFYNGNENVPAQYRIDTTASLDTTKRFAAQQGVNVVKGTHLTGFAAPVTTGKTLAKNLKTAFEKYADNVGGDVATNKAGYVYSDNNALYGGAGWMNVAVGTKPFITLAEVTAYAAQQNFDDEGNANATNGRPIVKNGVIVSTESKPDVDTWYAGESGDAATLLPKMYVETTYNIPATGTARTVKAEIKAGDLKKDEATITITGRLTEGDVIAMDLLSTVTKTSKNALVSVDSKMVKADNLVYVTVSDAGFTASVKKTVKIAQDEVVFLNDNGLKLKESVKGSFQEKDEVSLRISKGFKFAKTDVYVNGEKADASFDGNELTFKVTGTMLKAANAVDEDGLVTLTIKSEKDGLKIEADGAKSGTKATITAKVGKLDKVTVEVAEVVDYKVVMSADKDKDLPVIYSGTNVNNDGITNSSNHKTVEITLEETFPGAWSMRQGFNITLPDGVYVADVEVKDAENFFQNGKELGSADAKKAWQDAFEKAYKDGKYKNFEFGKRVFDDVNVTLAKNPAKVTFVLVLVADPTFEGDVKVGFEGSLVEKQSVSAAKFVVPYKVEAQQNDLKIDSRNTKIPTEIVVKETADGLWDKKASFAFNIEKDLIRFEDDAKFTVDKNSELEVTDTQKNNKLEFSVKSISDKAATVTISDMSLYMNRNIPAGKYALEMNSTMTTAYDAQRLYAYADSNAAKDARDNKTDLKLKGDNYISDVTKYKKTVKDSFINVVTAPRDEDGFTTKISVPVGEKFVMAGEKKVEIDTPAYINANGYTMLPLRAVAVALGIDNNSVLWDQNTRTATILYGNRVVSMQAGAKSMYINGQAVATKAGVEITNDRTFLSLRDLGTAVNVKDITWDAATKTAYLNYGEKAA